MISDTEVKIAENPEEAFWTQFKERCEKDIKTHEREIIINEHLIKLANEKLAENENGK